MRTKHKTVLLHKSVYTEQPKEVDEWLLEAENRGLVAKITEFLFRGMDGHMPQ